MDILFSADLKAQGANDLDIVQDDEWGLYPHFTKDEMKCHYTGLCYMTHAMMKTLEDIRVAYGKPMIVSSGYRDVSNPVERGKPEPGEHTFGMAADILIYGPDAINLLRIATENGIHRIGVSQKGDMNKRFLHFGVGDRVGKFPVAVWSY